MDRYFEGYIEAKLINGFGITIKAIASIIGGLLLFGGIIACADSGGFLGSLPGIVIVLFGLLIGGIGLILGILVQAAGQLLKAHFDCAVYQSRFLDDDQRAKVMSLD
jgi:hypothetical protein